MNRLLTTIARSGTARMSSAWSDTSAKVHPCASNPTIEQFGSYGGPCAFASFKNRFGQFGSHFGPRSANNSHAVHAPRFARRQKIRTASAGHSEHSRIYRRGELGVR